jgi:hypothetical protein
MTIRQTRSEFEEEILQLLAKRFGRTEAVKLAKEYSAKIHASYSVRAAPSIVVSEIAKYEKSPADDTTEFRHLLNGHFFKFVVDEETEGPQGGKFAPTYVKTGERSYMSPLAPNTSSKYQHRIGGKAPVRIVKSYPTHAFPNPRY